MILLDYAPALLFCIFLGLAVLAKKALGGRP